jgi:hypothetical protein
MLPRGLPFPCIATQAAAVIRRVLFLWRTSGDTWWGSGVRCGSICGRGQSSRSAELPSRCSRAPSISMIPHDSVAVSLPGIDTHLTFEVYRGGAGQESLVVGFLCGVRSHCTLMCRALWELARMIWCFKRVVRVWSRRSVCGSVRRMRRAWWFAPACDVVARRCHCYHRPTIMRQYGPSARVADHQRIMNTESAPCILIRT